MARRYTPPQPEPEEPYYSVEAEPAEERGPDLIGLPEEQYHQALDLQRQMEALGPRPVRPNRRYWLLELLQGGNSYDQWNQRAFQIQQALKELAIQGRFRKEQDRELRQQRTEMRRAETHARRMAKDHKDLEAAIAGEKEARERLSDPDLSTKEATRLRKDWESKHREVSQRLEHLNQAMEGAERAGEEVSRPHLFGLFTTHGKRDQGAEKEERGRWSMYSGAGRQSQEAIDLQERRGFHTFEDLIGKEDEARAAYEDALARERHDAQQDLDEARRQEEYLRSIGAQENMGAPTPAPPASGSPAHRLPPSPQPSQIRSPSAGGGGGSRGAGGAQHFLAMGPQGMNINIPPAQSAGLLQTLFRGFGGGGGKGGGGVSGGPPGMNPGQVSMGSPGANVPLPPQRPAAPMPPVRPNFAQQVGQRMGISPQAPSQGVAMPQGQTAPSLGGYPMSGNFADAVMRARGMPSQAAPPMPPPRPGGERAGGPVTAQTLLKNLNPAQQQAFMDQIQRQEGWHPGSMSYRHNNPGNLMPRGREATFPSYAAGREALRHQLFDPSRVGYQNMPIGRAMQTYAPSGHGGNNPAAYSAGLVAALNRGGSQPGTMMAQRQAPEGLQMASTRGGPPTASAYPPRPPQRPQTPMPPPRPQQGVPMPPSRPETPLPPSRPQGLTPPQPGTVMGGYRFKGGDPSKRANWEAMQ